VQRSLLETSKSCGCALLHKLSLIQEVLACTLKTARALCWRNFLKGGALVSRAVFRVLRCR